MTDRLRAAATMAMAALQNHGDACHQVHHAIEELRAALAEPQPDLRQARNDALLEAADVCDQHASVEGIAQRCADAIRAIEAETIKRVKEANE